MSSRGGRKAATTAPKRNRVSASSSATAASKKRAGSSAAAAAGRRRANGGLRSIAEGGRSNSNSSNSESDDDHRTSNDGPNHSSTSNSSADSAHLHEAAAPAKASGSKRPAAASTSTSSSSASSSKRRHPPAFEQLPPPTKRSRNNSHNSASTAAGSGSPADLRVELQLFSSVRSVLATQYFNVVERLQLDFQPGCLSNLEYCSQYHSRNGDPPNEIDDYLVRDARNFISEDRPHVFLKFVAKLSVSNDFPGTQLVLSLLELILTVNRPAHQHYTAPFIIESANLLFENITNNFPPCWLDVRDSYKRLLVERLHIELPKSKYDTSGGILKTVLSMLETVLQEECDAGGALGDSVNESADFEEFEAWERRNKQRYLFEQLPRDDKLDRIFQVLHLLVKMMEGDLAIWIIRHPKNTSSTMSKPKKMPLIGYFLWPAEECGQINALVKRILNLFVICISIGVAEEQVKILARFVNLVSHAINLCELQPKSGEIKYPNIQTHTEIFALEVKKTIEKIQTCNVDLFLAVIDHLRAPFIQIIAIDQLLMKFNRDVGKPSMKKLHQNFMKRRWRECDEEGSRKLFTHQPDAFNMSRYPVYRPLTAKKRTSDIYQTDYLHLLQSSYRSYQLLYQVDVITKLNEAPALAEEERPSNDDAATAAASSSSSKSSHKHDRHSGAAPQPDADVECGMSASEYEEHTRTVNKQRQDKFNFLEMEKGIRRLERLAEKSAALDVAYYPHIDCTMNDIVVDAATVMRYREDMKHYLMLRDLIEEYGAEYGEMLAPWVRAVRRKPVIPPMARPMAALAAEAEGAENEEDGDASSSR